MNGFFAAAPTPAPNCGCETAPSCGCGDSTCDGGCRKGGLLNRLRSKMGNRGDDSCCTPFPNSGCSNCGGGAMMSETAPAQAPMSPVPDASEETEAPAPDKTLAPVPDPPVVPVPDKTPAKDGGIAPAVAPDDKGASHGITIDPDAFLIKG